jgi:murein DD-endopeptidase MepM/ murein hydrolase activator NlpD
MQGYAVHMRHGDWLRATTVALLVLLVAVPATAAPESAAPQGPPPADAPPADPDDPADAEEEEVKGEAELAVLAAARAAVTDRMVASAGAEGARRRAEEALVAAHDGVRDAEEELVRVTRLLDDARTRLYEARRAQREAQEHFDLSVATAYKFGGAQSTALLLTAIQSASDAHDLARAVDELDNVLGHSYDELGRRIRATERAEERVDAVERQRDVAARRVQEAEAAVEPVAAEADRARAAARVAEGALLAAAEHALNAEQAALDAEADPAAIQATGAGDPLAPGSATVDPLTGPSVEQRRAWLANRRGVLADQASLPAEAWDVRRNLTCPVAGSSFGNDFHFPRSHGRRHLGTDVFAPEGSPIVAMADGEVTAIDPTDGFNGESDLGGITVSVTTEVGRFYAAHLLRIPDGLGVGDRVQAGDVVGYVGTSGNARGTPSHLHLGWYVDEVEINPWPTLAHVCATADGD